METRGTLFREIHKNTWLKRLTVDNKKITVGSGSKKSDRSWVVFCVHDDCEATLEGYVDMREAGSHIPEWTVNLQTTLHISHALVPSEQEYEFVITLASDVVRFNAASWEIMQEWVDTLRQKLREMKILSPRENLYSKLPEIRAPLLPTRDPTSPLPAPPPVPAAIVPGIERITSPSPSSHSTATANNRAIQPATVTSTAVSTTISSPTTQTSNTTTTSSSQVTSCIPSTSFSPIPVTAMSNTLTQNLMNMLSNPVSTYSSQLSNIQSSSNSSNGSVEDTFFFEDEPSGSGTSQFSDINFMHHHDGTKNRKVDNLSSLAKTFADNVLADPITCPLTSASALQTTADSHLQNDGETSSSSSTPSAVYQEEPLVIPRPQTSRNSSRDNQMKRLAIQPQILSAIPTSLSDEVGTTNITIIQVSSPISSTKTSKEIFNFPTINPTIEKADSNFRSNVQIIPSNYSPPPSIASNANAILPIKGKTNITVQVSGSSLASGYGKIIKQGLHRSESQPSANATSSNIADALSSVRNFGAVTNIPIGSDEKPSNSMHYEQVFITPSTSSEASEDNRQLAASKIVVPKKQPKSSSQTELHVNRINLHKETATNKENVPSEELAVASPSTSGTQTIAHSNNASTVASIHNKNSIPNSAKKPQAAPRENLPSPLPAIRKFLTRGLTEACISRQSRKDSSNEQRQPTKNNETHVESSNNDSSKDESHEQRRRSSSTSDAQGSRTRATNNNANATVSGNESRNRIQPAPQPFRPENSHSTRLTLREQQVMQLRREMIHPGGVRIQLRRKDCIGSIALVDAFGAVWVSGWKQKEHPMLYNALHIGDQLVSVAGVTISTSSEANRVIRNAPGLYIELIIRRVPFGRVYAIRREMDGQCLGLIRDGNTATIVDVVPKSLSARYGLPPKAQSCDGLSLTFWVLTEINGRPLNLFFKDNEVRDRLNSVGRDISILVQPSDLVTKLKKQLKSMRSYKEYIVQ
ncbi:hypothetical protein Bhyg_10977 [Pseudolycoriella hygida]|uniref:Uncharacterized protein n=1 Tax=Pseudolycoriella hygida TaxID=35572 RepID=A0A9Q0MW45_9DIPT|nr:hypothetical protein Bhyg_10977 [Pseudolycoriella hygida]